MTPNPAPTEALPPLPERDNDGLRIAVWDAMCYWKDSPAGVDALMASDAAEDMIDMLLEAYARSAVAADRTIRAGDAAVDGVWQPIETTPTTGGSEPDWSHLKQYGYASGDYMGKCHTCEKIVEFVDKRASICRPCAEARHATRNATEAATPTPAQAVVLEALRIAEEAKSHLAQAIEDTKQGFDVLTRNSQWAMCRESIDRLATLVQPPEAPAEGMQPEIERLRELAATCYAGLGGECDLPEPWLDALLQAANGEPFSLDGLLPFSASTEAPAAVGASRVADEDEEREIAAWRDTQIEHERDLDHLHDVINQHSHDATHWFKECNEARDCLRHLLEECRDSEECSSGFLSTGRVQEIIARDIGELPARSEDEPNSYVDGPRLATMASTPAPQVPSEAARLVGGEAVTYTEREMYEMQRAGKLPDVQAWLTYCKGEPQVLPELRRRFGWCQFHTPVWMPLVFKRSELPTPFSALGQAAPIDAPGEQK